MIKKVVASTSSQFVVFDNILTLSAHLCCDLYYSNKAFKKGQMLPGCYVPVG